MTSRFKVLIKTTGGEERWADGSKLFAYLLKEYTKAELKGKKPEPYKDRVDSFFKNIDEEWIGALKDAYPNIDIKQELKKAKIWLLSSTQNAKSDFKKFVNNWMAKAMNRRKVESPQNNQSNYEKYVPRVINEDEIASPEEIKEILRRK